MFLRNNPTPENITHTADKLRWYRYSNCVHQEDIAKVAGIHRTTYIDYESGNLDFYPIEKLQLIAEFYGIEVTKLLDDYNLYMYKGQGQQVKALRKSMGMTQYQFGALLNLGSSNVKRWESDNCRMFKSTWEKLQKLTPP